MGRRHGDLVVLQLGAELDRLAARSSRSERIVTASTTRDESPNELHALRIVACSSGAPTTTAA
jgi:hypothetical protein